MRKQENRCAVNVTSYRDSDKLRKFSIQIKGSAHDEGEKTVKATVNKEKEFK